MKIARSSNLILICFLFLNQTVPASAQAGIQLVSDEPSISFPESVTFKAEFHATKNIIAVTLEYGVDQLTCGTVVAKAFPQFTEGSDVQVEWTWEMRQSGSLPPGASLWWRWQVQDADGTRFTSPMKTILWLDNLHNWQVISGGNIDLHYYEGGQNFGQSLHEAAAQALERLSKDVGLSAEKPVDIYIYANTNDLKDAILYEPSWVGGQAFPENNIVIIGVPVNQLEWGKSTEAHELTHVLVGHLTFTCLGFIPTWLNEGLAMYGEGGPGPVEAAQFTQAKADNQLLPLRSLTGGFSEESNRATLSYSEAFSVVDFLIKTFGQEEMNAFLTELRDGETTDQALLTVYGFNTDGLEDAWRTSINANPRIGSANPTPVFTPTQVPTFVPIGGVPAAPSAPTLQPTQVQTLDHPPATTPETNTRVTSQPLAERLGISQGLLTGIEFGLMACILAILVICIIIFITVRRSSRRQQ